MLQDAARHADIVFKCQFDNFYDCQGRKSIRVAEILVIVSSSAFDGACSFLGLITFEGTGIRRRAVYGSSGNRKLSQ